MSTAPKTGPHAGRPWRDIVRSESAYEEHESSRGYRYSWWVVEVHRLTLECGHVQERRGCRSGVPTKRVICKDCEAGEPKVPIDGVEPSRVVDDGRDLPRSPVARALLLNEVAKATEASQ